MVIFGNPPYRGENMNRNEHIDSLMQAYKIVAESQDITALIKQRLLSFHQG